MGFVPKRRIYELAFEDDMEGLEVSCRSVSMDLFFEISELADNAETGDIKGLVESFTEHVLLEWNVEDEDEETKERTPVAADAAGLGKQDVDFVLGIVRAWVNALTAASAPLDDAPSPGGEESSTLAAVG